VAAADATSPIEACLAAAEEGWCLMNTAALAAQALAEQAAAMPPGPTDIRPSALRLSYSAQWIAAGLEAYARAHVRLMNALAASARVGDRRRRLAALGAAPAPSEAGASPAARALERPGWTVSIKPDRLLPALRARAHTRSAEGQSRTPPRTWGT
jgi:hypothetical protein